LSGRASGKWANRFVGYTGLAAAIVDQSNQDWDILRYRYQCPECGTTYDMEGGKPPKRPRCQRVNCNKAELEFIEATNPYRQGIELFCKRGVLFPVVCELLNVEPAYMQRLLVHR